MLTKYFLFVCLFLLSWNSNSASNNQLARFYNTEYQIKPSSDHHNSSLLEKQSDDKNILVFENEEKDDELTSLNSVLKFNGLNNSSFYANLVLNSFNANSSLSAKYLNKISPCCICEFQILRI